MKEPDLEKKWVGKKRAGKEFRFHSFNYSEGNGGNGKM